MLHLLSMFIIGVAFSSACVLLVKRKRSLCVLLRANDLYVFSSMRVLMFFYAFFDFLRLVFVLG